jgi:alkanesulfonate monooxygenase SsuD/methylene tetrahydromethanopterin reductase-like flavin-dependent oxidoreductase (luciferase family)
VINPYSRHPALIAMEFGALNELVQGRPVLGTFGGSQPATDVGYLAGFLKARE